MATKPKTNSKTKSTKTSKSTKQSAASPSSPFRHPSTWLIIVLAVAFIATVCVSAISLKTFNSNSNSAIDSAKLAVFDHLVGEALNNTEVTSDTPSIKEATGYGISDEDGVFYVTFDYVTYDVSDPNQPVPSEPKHAIMYFWEDAERGTYSHAFSYHDDASYHPAGTYIEISK